MDINNVIAAQVFHELLLDDDGSSSSSDEAEDEGFEGIIRGPLEKRPRIEGFIEDVVERYNEIEFKQNFRMNRDNFNVVLDLIKDKISSGVIDNGRHALSPKTQLLVVLWYLGTPDSYRSVCGRFNIGKATGLRTTRRVVDALFELGPTFINWPNAEAANAIKEDFARQGFPDTIGCIDGCHIPIPLPKEHGQSYINRKGFSSLVLQVVCDQSLKFRHVYAGEAGSSHDARVFKNSDLYQKIMDNPRGMFPEHSHLVGDSAYPCLPQLMTPYRNNGHLTLRQRNFNYKLSKVRSNVERSLALLKQRFRCLKYLDMQCMDWAPKYIVACAVLHNICIMQNDNLEGVEVINIDELEEHPNFVINDNVLRQLHQQGERKRNQICALLDL